MKLFRKFKAKIQSLKPKRVLSFQSILIVTYGRTGSTLLQGLLNAIDGCLIRGENNQFCYELFGAYKHIISLKTKIAPRPTHPFYGSHLYNEKIFLSYSQRMIKKLLLADANEKQVVCYGFKEVRYINVLDNLFEYLNFLEMIFPNVAIIFLTRDSEDVLKSGWWPERDQEETRKNMRRCENLFTEYENKHSNAFLITYEDIIKKSPNLRELYNFLGAGYSDATIDRILAVPHSYPVKK